MRGRLVAAAVIAGLVVGASCTLFEDDIPDRSCMNDTDCFRAQGERCDLLTQTCVMRVDAAPVPDARPPDAMVDAMVDAP